MKALLQNILLCDLMLFAGAGWAQPTLTSGNTDPVTGDKLIYNNSAYISPGDSGANQTWDLSSMSSTGTDTNYIVTVSSTPYASSFSNANIADKTGSNYGYYKLSSASYQNYGIVNGPGEVIPYSNPEDILRFPFTYNDNYQDPFGATYSNNGYNYYRSGTISVKADSYGNLKLPGHTYQNVLRVHFVELYQDSANIYNTPFVIPYQNNEYTWYLPGNTNAIAAVYTITVSGVPSSQGFYMNNIVSGIEESGNSLSSLTLFPNPASTELNLDLTLNENKKTDLKLFNVLGAEAGHFQFSQGFAGINHFTMNLNGLPDGIYFAMIYLDGVASGTRKFIVAK
jgi:hypothetical protein